jgi:hypothetical protein
MRRRDTSFVFCRSAPPFNLAAVWKSDSEALLEALRTSPYRQMRPLEFNAPFGYILGNRDGIDNWRLIPASLRRSLGLIPLIGSTGGAKPL